MDKITIGTRIRDERMKLGLTLVELGYKLGVSKQCLSSWEHGRNMPDIISLNAIAEICGLELQDFLHYSPKKQAKAVLEKSGTLELTDKEYQIINKFRAMSAEKRKAFEVLLGVRER